MQTTAKVEVITDRAALAALKPAWDALARRHCSPLLSYDWFVTSLETLNADDPVRVVVLWEQGEVRAIAPLCLERHDAGVVLALIGATVLYEPMGFLYTDAQSLDGLLRGVIGLGWPLLLLRMPDDPILHDCLDRLAWKRGVIYSRETAPSAFLTLPDAWDVFLSRLSANRRYDFKRKRKCLEKVGQVTTRIVKPAATELAGLLRQAMDIEDAGWKGQNGSSLLKNPALRAFFDSYAEKACADGILRLCFIDVDGRPVSMHIAVEANDALWVLKLGYDEALSRCSPGVQLAMDTIEYSVRQRLSRYEFLGSEEDWQHAWPVQRHAQFTVLICPYTFSGLRGGVGFVLSVVRKLLAHR